MSDWAATERQPASVLLAEGVELHGDLHLQAHVAYREGPESPLEMLNRPDPFFVLSLADGGVVFISRDQVAVVSCAPRPAIADPDRMHAAKQATVEVVLWGGTQYRGWVTIELPPSRARTLDFLNGAGRFFAVGTETENRFVNRSHVCLVRPLE